MLLNCGVGEDSWESLGLQENPISPSYRKSVLNIQWKGWCWSWNSNTLASWCEEWTHWKRPWYGKDWRWEEKGMTEDEMVGWHHWLDEHEFGQALGLGDGQGSLVCCSPKEWLVYWCHKESGRTERLNWKRQTGNPWPSRAWRLVGKTDGVQTAITRAIVIHSEKQCAMWMAPNPFLWKKDSFLQNISAKLIS